jgi:serine/threonine protein kinase
MAPVSDALELTLGATIDRYEIVRHLGIGAMGTVYLARDPTLDREVAIKLLRHDLVHRKDLLSRFKREAKAVARINHSNVVQIFDTGQHDEAPYFVMEYLEGIDCGKLVKDYGRLPGAIVAAIGLDAARGLAEAARAVVIHRDVKPANLVVTERGPIKVTDFGLAKAQLPASTSTADKLTMQGATLGTPDYMSPEQAMGADLDARTDIYSLGATLFHLLSARPPFRSLDEDIGHMEVVTRHVTDTAPRLDELVPGVDLRLVVLVAEMMAKGADERPTYDEVEQRLQPLAHSLDKPVLEELRRSSTGMNYPAATFEVDSGPQADETDSAPTQRPRRVPPTQRQTAANSTLEVPRLVPRWALVSSGISLLIFGISLTAFLIFQPGVRLRFLGGARAQPTPVTAPADLGADTAAAIPSGYVLLTLPSGARLLVAERPASEAQAREVLGKRRVRGQSPTKAATGLSLREARQVARHGGYRLPTSEEWPHLVADARVKLTKRGCEWVDDASAQDSAAAKAAASSRARQRGSRCFRRLKALKRASASRRYGGSVFRLVSERPGARAR